MRTLNDKNNVIIFEPGEEEKLYLL